MNWHAVRAIVGKDLASVRRNRGVRIPLLVTPIMVLVFLPVLLVGFGEVLATSGALPDQAADASPFGNLSESQPGSAAATVASPQGRWALFVLETFLAPLYLLVPLVVATVIAADSFAGERERGTLEALLHTATSDRELLVAKFLASFVPAVAVAWVSFAMYSVLANVLAWPYLGRIFFPTVTWLLLAFWMAPVLAAFGLGMMVIASSRVKSLQAAHQIGSLVVIPIILMLVAQLAGVLQFEPVRVAIMGLVVALAALVLVTFGSRSLRRERLATKL